MTGLNALPAPTGLLRILGIGFGLAVVVGGMVGAGIMRAPGVVALGLSSPALILLAWALGGAYSFPNAQSLTTAAPLTCAQ